MKYRITFTIDTSYLPVQVEQIAGATDLLLHIRRIFDSPIIHVLVEGAEEWNQRVDGHLRSGLSDADYLDNLIERVKEVPEGYKLDHEDADRLMSIKRSLAALREKWM